MENEKVILIVDDDERNIVALGSILRSEGFEIFTASNGQVCIDILKSNNFIDLILLDMMMPVLDGYETLRVIRNDEMLKHIPIISLTALAMKGDREKCLNAGATDYCSKPFDIDDLIVKMNKLIGK